jgi:hypothetical protein
MPSIISRSGCFAASSGITSAPKSDTTTTTFGSDKAISSIARVHSFLIDFPFRGVLLLPGLC